MALTIEITSDFICPWCLVAETRLNSAIAKLNPAIAVQRVWCPFELNPNMPEAGMNRQAYRTQKFGSWEYSQLLDAKTIHSAQDDELEFRYDLMKVTPNTLKAHRLTWFAAQHGKATVMASRIFKAYFTDGQNIGDIDTLNSLATEVGIDGYLVKNFLQSDAGTSEVKELERQAVARGVQGVPSIHIGNDVLSGAQPLEVLSATLQKAVREWVEA